MLIAVDSLTCFEYVVMINDRAMQWYVWNEPACAERSDYCHVVIDYRSRAGDEEWKSYITRSNTPPTP